MPIFDYSSISISVCRTLTTKEDTNNTKESSNYHYKDLTADLRKKLKISETERFKYYYKSSKHLLDDFVVYLTKVCFKSKKVANELASSVRSVWLELDKDMLLQPNSLANPDKLEDSYFHPRVTKIRVQHF